MGSQPWEEHHVLPELKENLEELFPGLTIEEALQHQESLYQSLKISCLTIDQIARSSDNEPSSSHEHSWGESSFSGSCDYDLALDEAVARSLQELDLEEEIDHDAISESLRSASRNSEPAAAAGTSVSETIQDSVDPDEMTYEELQSLGEAIGSENQGLSKSEISSLPRHTHKSGIFSKKIDIGDCVICFTTYKNRDSIISLPCLHQYHKDCIEPWLVKKRICPLCKKEVKLS
ncbi:E3 ubiquitin ligase BIG BROTHER-like [Chenopodium quinoa]|uniref:E3 ubiquitin ligase BIG BROTHER-like n=1 Tax=Chenopodium quinoa TaxID=63459 RepID=UPI000B7936F7|nr:E3 ubiquitin ligase BIG BROTHER-like [Chenopodium quinoa]XP_021765170.1 E3 ubiquitin ligase BIG BROTHER-like [Chenopodium quinoa]